jgi:hypothetical protein
VHLSIDLYPAQQHRRFAACPNLHPAQARLGRRQAAGNTQEREITGRPKGARPDTHTKQQTICKPFSAKVRKDPIKPRDGARKQNTSYMNLLREKPRIWERKGRKGKQSTAMEKPTKTKLQNDLERERHSYKRNRNRAITEQLDQPAKATTTYCNATTPPVRS